MTNLEVIRQKLLAPSGVFVLPSAMKDTPLQMPEWEIQDENGEGTGEYYTPRSLSKALGSLLVLVDVLVTKDPEDLRGYFLMRYGIDWDTLSTMESVLDSNHLFNVRKNDDGTYKLPSELDYTSFVGNEYMILPPYLVGGVPKIMPAPEEEDASAVT